MKHRLLAAGALLATVFASAGFVMQDNRAPTSGLITLFAEDDRTCSFSFEDGDFGPIIDNVLRLDLAQMVYHRYEPGRLSFGLVRNEKVNVVDLGDVRVDSGAQPTDVAVRSPISVFHSLFLDRRRIFYTDAEGRPKHYGVGQKVMNTFDREGVQHLDPVVGHTYLVRYRLAPLGRGQDGRIVRLHVIDVEPGRFVTLRWGFVD